MSPTVITADPFLSEWVGRPTDDCDFFASVKVLGGRVFSVAKRITQNEYEAADVLIESFLEVWPDRDDCRADEGLWLELMTVVVRKAFSRLRNRGEKCQFPDRAEFWGDRATRQLSVWDDNFPQRYSLEWTTRVLESGLRDLDPVCRAVFVLRDLEEISIEHTATIVNGSVAAVGFCLLTARLQLRDALERQMRNPQ